MIPAIVAALAPILVGEVAKAAVGDTPAAGKVADAAVSVVSQVSGIPITDEHSARNASQALQLDPTRLAEVYRLQAEQVLPLLTLDNEDRVSARGQTVELAKAGSRIAWGAPVVSVVVLLTFGAVLSLVLTKSIPAGQETTVSIMLGALTTMATAVVSYWVGSSAGSAAKDKLLRER
jgi:hypothetical protein